jgi:hypothetical protein
MHRRWSGQKLALREWVRAPPLRFRTPPLRRPKDELSSAVFQNTCNRKKNGTASKMIIVLTVDPVLAYSSRETMKNVIGSTTLRRSRTRCIGSNWPLQ